MGLKKEEDSPLFGVSSRQLGLETLCKPKTEQALAILRQTQSMVDDGFTSEVVHYGQKKLCCIPMYT